MQENKSEIGSKNRNEEKEPLHMMQEVQLY